MSFETAILCHSDWKQRLAAYLRQPDGSLDAAQVGRDDACHLGEWIHGPGLTYSAVPGYATLRTEHARFHREAGDVVARAHRGDPVLSEVTLGAASPFAEASRAVVTAIVQMRHELQKLGVSAKSLP